MPKTSCNEPLKDNFRYSVKTEIGNYIMAQGWIDTTQPNDMMDYDFTAPISELKAIHEEFRIAHIRSGGIK